MELLKIFLSSLGSLFALFILTKMLGNRQITQLTMFDYVIGITIGSIAAEMATSLEQNPLNPLLAMVTYALVSFLLAQVALKSIRFRRFLNGKTLILFDNGKIYEKNLKKARLDTSELFTQCRNAGYFDLNNIETIVLELNGKMSFLPKSSSRPLTPNDMKLNPSQEKLCVNVVIDGKILKDNLKFTGNNRIWLQRQLKAQGIVRIDDVFLAFCDVNNNLTAYRRTRKFATRDMFE